MTDASRREDGCVEYGCAEDVFDPGLIHVKELWTDQAALDRRFVSAHIAEWRAAWANLGIGDRDLRVYDVTEPRKTLHPNGPSRLGTGRETAARFPISMALGDMGIAGLGQFDGA